MSCCEVEVHPLVTLTSSFLMAVTVLLDIFPLEIDTLTLCMDIMTEIPSTIMEAPFCRILHIKNKTFLRNSMNAVMSS